MEKKINFKELEKTREEKAIELALLLKYIKEIRIDTHEKIEYNSKDWKKLWKMLDTQALRIEDYNMFTDTINKINLLYDDICLLLLKMEIDTENKLQNI